MDPSQVRSRILTDHAALRGLLDQLEGAAAAPDEEAMPILRDTLGRLRDAFEAHLALEDQILVPTLRELDAWGEVRASQVDHDHARQRTALRKLEATAANLLDDPDGLVALARTFAEELRADMAEEEGYSLSPNLLRDDPVAVNQSSG